MRERERARESRPGALCPAEAGARLGESLPALTQGKTPARATATVGPMRAGPGPGSGRAQSRRSRLRVAQERTAVFMVMRAARSGKSFLITWRGERERERERERDEKRRKEREA